MAELVLSPGKTAVIFKPAGLFLGGIIRDPGPDDPMAFQARVIKE